MRKMRWWGWLVIAVFGPLIWGSIVGVLSGMGIISSYDTFEAGMFGATAIWLACIAIPLILKATTEERGDGT